MNSSAVSFFQNLGRRISQVSGDSREASYLFDVGTHTLNTHVLTVCNVYVIMCRGFEIVRYPLCVRYNASVRTVQGRELAVSVVTVHDSISDQSQSQDAAGTSTASAADDDDDDDSQLSNAVLSETLAAVTSDYGTMFFSVLTRSSDHSLTPNLQLASSER